MKLTFSQQLALRDALAVFESSLLNMAAAINALYVELIDDELNEKFEAEFGHPPPAGMAASLWAHETAIEKAAQDQRDKERRLVDEARTAARSQVLLDDLVVHSHLCEKEGLAGTARDRYHLVRKHWGAVRELMEATGWLIDLGQYIPDDIVALAEQIEAAEGGQPND